MPVLSKKIRNTKELIDHLPHRTQMIPSGKLIAFLDCFFTCFTVIKLMGGLHFKACSTVLESAKRSFLIIRLNFLTFCVNFLFFSVTITVALNCSFLVFTASIYIQTIIIS